MMNKGLLIILVGAFLFVASSLSLKAQDSLEVSFSVNLSVLIESGDFNATDYTPKIAGSFNGWQDGAVELLDQSDSTFSQTILIENTFVGDTLQYKFILVNGDGDIFWEKNFPTNSLNREYGVNGSETDTDGNDIPNQVLNHNWNDFPLDILDTPSPETAAPTPTENPDLVISLFSDAYDDVVVDAWRTIWSNAVFTDDFADGNPVKKYVGLDFVGIETVSNQLDITEMTHFSFDLWTPNATTFRAKIVDFGANGEFAGDDDSEHEIVWENPAQGEWIEYNIPLEDFSGLNGKSNIAQLIFSGLPTNSVTAFIDNIYFYKDDEFAGFPKPPYEVGDTLNVNGSFAESELLENQGGTNGWFFDLNNGASTYSIVDDSQDGDNRSLKVNVAYNDSPEIWHVQAVNEPIFVEEQDLIIASFWMKAADEGRRAEVFLGLPEAGDYQEVVTESFDLTTEWARYEIEYFVDGFSEQVGMRLGIKMNAPENDEGMIFIDNVQLIKQEVVITEVNFSVNTSVQQALENFDPNVHIVGLAGEFQGWNASAPIEMTTSDNVIYEGSIVLPNVSIGDTLGYKFILKDENTGIFEWESPDRSTGATRGEFNDRVLEITDLNSITKPEVFYSDIEPTDQTPSNYGITPLIDARGTDIGTHLAIQGIVTRTTNNFVYVQDETAASMMFSRPLFSGLNAISFNEAVQNGEISVGDEVQIAGITTDFSGLHELTKIHGWEVLSTDNPLPEAQLISIDEMNENGEEYESELVRMEFIQLDEEADTLRGGFLYELTNLDGTESGWISIQGSGNSEWEGQVPPQGLFNFEGVLKDFYIPSIESNIYAISVHDFTDLETGLNFFDADLQLPSLAGLLNKSFVVPIYLNDLGEEAIEGFEFSINFDSELVEISLGDQTGTLTEGFSVLSNELEPGKLVISGANATGISELGILINLDVNFVGGGVSLIEMEDILFNEKPIFPLSSEFNVVLRRCGDVTGDETVSALDATAVLRHTVFLTPEYPLAGLDSTAADVTGNGDISAFDASKILQLEVGLIEGLDCITLPIKKNPEIVNANWFLQDGEGDSKIAKLNFEQSSFDIYSIELALNSTSGVTFKRVKNLPKDWNMIQNTVDNTTLISLYGVTPISEKMLDLEFNSSQSGTIEAELTVNENKSSELEKLTVSEIPNEFDLKQNYPNPFNPSTQIQYSLAENGVVNLSIYNMLGQKVAELVNANQEAGQYQVTWNAGSLSSGVYIYRLSTKDNTFTKRMMLIK
ncbi:MAG: hypothetical protein BalsKO_10890 [Balneolaceae bacterium]